MNTEKMTARIRALFAKAESTTYESEAETYLAKAYELLAQHGIEEAVARAGAGTDSSEISKWVFTPTGPYKYDQIMLVGCIVDALHCSAVKTADNKRVTVYGVKAHLDRAEMLAGFLVAYMLGLAVKSEPEFPWESKVTYRKSVMAGFMSTVHNRLKRAEKQAAGESEDAKGAALVLMSDSRRAEEAMRAAANGPLGTAAAPRRSRAGWSAGEEAANSVDLGGGNRVGGRRAIAG